MNTFLPEILLGRNLRSNSRVCLQIINIYSVSAHFTTTISAQMTTTIYFFSADRFGIIKKNVGAKLILSLKWIELTVKKLWTFEVGCAPYGAHGPLGVNVSYSVF